MEDKQGWATWFRKREELEDVQEHELRILEKKAEIIKLEKQQQLIKTITYGVVAFFVITLLVLGSIAGVNTLLKYNQNGLQINTNVPE